ncbi:hypothetical protein J437_LFUL002597 [Ladona fulva]|uniref:Flotillin n=1 Tax=Ladona fulva TaxID=123851 RepID=A0A8K0NWS0_LADFU|nr:hypothetical protein J437_LFUL002597 [Ladona fulva]
MCEHVETAQGVPLTVTGVAQCKIMKAEELLQTASEQFLGKTTKEVKMTVLQTLEGHLRAILVLEKSSKSQSFLPSGGCCGSTKKTTIVGGWAWAWWLVTDVQRISLEVKCDIPIPICHCIIPTKPIMWESLEQKIM